MLNDKRNTVLVFITQGLGVDNLVLYYIVINKVTISGRGYAMISKPFSVQ